MDRERVKEETASRGDRERDRGRQERERDREGERETETREKKERKIREISFQRRAKKQLLSNTSSSLPFVFFPKIFFLQPLFSSTLSFFCTT